jgi:anaerobic selenocysteine-containing dehydrogenase
MGKGLDRRPETPVNRREDGAVGVREDVWIPSICESQCADAPCLLRVHRINGVAVGVEPNTEIEGYEELAKNRGRLCPKAYGVIQKLYNPNRIKGPLKRTNPEKGHGVDPKWVDVSWDEALDIIAEKLRKIRAEDPRKLAEGGGIGGMRQAGWLLSSLWPHPITHRRAFYPVRSK